MTNCLTSVILIATKRKDEIGMDNTGYSVRMDAERNCYVIIDTKCYWPICDAPNNWKTERGARAWAKKNGIELVG